MDRFMRLLIGDALGVSQARCVLPQMRTTGGIVTRPRWREVQVAREQPLSVAGQAARRPNAAICEPEVASQVERTVVQVRSRPPGGAFVDRRAGHY